MDKEKTKYIVEIIDAIASLHNIPVVDSYHYLKRQGVLELIQNSYEDMKNKPIEEIVKLISDNNYHN